MARFSSLDSNAMTMSAGFKIRIPSNTTALKWLFCGVTAVLVSIVAFTMGLMISGAHSLRQRFIMALGDLDDAYSVRAVSVLYGAFNASCAFLAASCVLYGAMPAAGSGLPVRLSGAPHQLHNTRMNWRESSYQCVALD